MRFIIIILLFMPGLLSSETRSVKATRTDHKISIDGQLKEGCWQDAESSGGFVQKYPVEDTVPSEHTVVKVLFDNRNLYIGVHAYDSEPDKIIGRLSRRDTWTESDNITVYIDSYCDRRTCYTFETNPSGVKIDWYMFNDSWSDWGWNAVWDVGTHIDSTGWTAEFLIPFSILRFQNKDSLTFGFEVIRHISRKRETDEWQFISKDEQGFVSLFGTLSGITEIPAPKNLELLPYGVGRLTDEEGKKDYFYNGGCNLKYGIGSNVILDAAVNPDFGQVEADPSQLNLSVFETYYQEKRPFFMEGKDLFKTEYELFYSRRIGKPPGYFNVLPGDVIKDEPEFTTILGAVKLTGKMKGSNFGIVEAITAPEYALVDSSGVERERLIEPLTNYSVFRLKQDVMESSNIGITTTACNRKEGSSAYSGSADWNMKLFNNYSSEGQIALSRTLQSGYAYSVNLGKTGGQLVHWEGKYSEVSTDFDIKDLGYIYRNDQRELEGGLSFFTSNNWWVTHRMGSNLNSAAVWNFEGATLSREINGGSWITFRNYWNSNLWTGYDFPHYNDWITRGGPAVKIPSSFWVNFGISSDYRKIVGVSIAGSFWKTAGNSFSRSLFSYIDIKALSNLKVSFSPRYWHGFNYAQWVSNIDDDADGIMDHYVFAEMTTDILSASIRADIAFTKNMTLQLWMQPYIAVGKYSNYKELIDADSYQFSPYEMYMCPDFNQKFLKANAVLRWEYSPGSAVFFVITNSLSDFSHPGDFSPIRDLKSTFKASGERIYLIKIDKWISL